MKSLKNSSLIVCFLLALLFSCSEGNKSSVDLQQQLLKTEGGVIQQYVKEWQSDSLGCLNLRTKNKAEIIIDSMGLNSKEKFIKALGRPNATGDYEGELIFKYYFNTLCRDNKLIDSADYCIAEYCFLQSKLVRKRYVCQ